MRYVLCIVLCVAQGCALSRDVVLEKTAAGDSLLVKKTMATSAFAEQREGAGDFFYSGSPDGSFEMRAGTSVEGQSVEMEPLMNAIVSLPWVDIINSLAPILAEREETERLETEEGEDSWTPWPPPPEDGNVSR